MDSIKELELALFAENQKRQDVERQLAEAIAARDESQRALNQTATTEAALVMTL